MLTAAEFLLNNEFCCEMKCPWKLVSQPKTEFEAKDMCCFWKLVSQPKTAGMNDVTIFRSADLNCNW